MAAHRGASGAAARPTVSFDLDAVLIQNPFTRGVLPHLRRVLRAGPALCDLSAEEADRRIREAVAAEVRTRMAGGDLASAYDWDAIYRKVATSFGASAVPDVAGLVRHYCGRPDTIWLLQGAAETLDRLHADGYRLIATTNGFRTYQWPVLEALGIADRFDAVLAPDVTGVAKPDPRMLAGVEGLVAHVGDMLFHDVLLARQLGVTAVWIHADLPPELAVLPPAARAASPAFRTYLDRVVAEQPYRDAHPDAAPEHLRPDVVLVGVHELEQVALGAEPASGR